METSTKETQENSVETTDKDTQHNSAKSDSIPKPKEHSKQAKSFDIGEDQDQAQETPNPSGNDIKMCIVWLEILTEEDIVKHVNVHKEMEQKTAKPTESVETVETVYLTRSHTKAKTPRTHRLPRSASMNIAYLQDDASDIKSIPSPKRKRNQRPQREPSSTRIKADSFSTKNLSVWPLHRSSRSANLQNPKEKQGYTTTGSDKNKSNIRTSTTTQADVKMPSKGTFTTQSFHLKKTKKSRKFGCKLCDTICSSNKELTKHHQLKHNILYCDECSKAFNYPSSLAKHKYSHKELRFKCSDCNESFAFESKLKAHRISHRTLATHCCAYPTCKKCFKNKGDLTRHAKEHDGVVHKCPDCQYENPDIRNLASHRLTHTDIEKYICELCKKSFRFSTQRRRHLRDKKCTKLSKSPEH